MKWLKDVTGIFSSFIAEAGQKLRMKRISFAQLGVLAFACVFLGHLFTDELGRFQGQLGAQLDWAAQPGHRLVGALPREHGKTTLGTVALVLREVCIGTKRNIMLVAANQAEASVKLRQITSELENNQLLKDYFGPAIAPARDTKKHLVAYTDKEVLLAGGARICTLGFGGKVRGQLMGGRRLDLIILDDPEDDSSAYSPELRGKGRRWIDLALLNALDVKTGSLVWLGTLLHHDSVLSQMLERCADPEQQLENWRAFKLAAENEAGVPLWPGRWSRARLQQRRLEIGDEAFAQEYLNRPVSRLTQVFSNEHFHTYNREELHHGANGWSWQGAPLTVVAGVDPAIGEGMQHDYFAACVLGFVGDPTSALAAAGLVPAQGPGILVLEMQRMRIGFSEQLRLLSELPRRWTPRMVGIESVAYQAALSQAAWERGMPVATQAETRNKRVRIEAAALQVSRGRVRLPVEGEWVAEFRQEAMDYPAGRHDDQLDAFARAIELGIQLSQGSGAISSARAEYRPEVGDGFCDRGSNWVPAF